MKAGLKTMNTIRIFAMLVLLVALSILQRQDEVLKMQDRLLKSCDPYEAQASPDSRSQQPADLQCSVIHVPAAGCPSGYKRESSPRFTERDGSKQYACISHDPKKEPCMDVLKAGESMQMIIQPPPVEIPANDHTDPNERAHK